MPSSDPASVVDSFISAVERKDIGEAVSMLAPEVSYENMPIDPVVGRDNVRAVLEGFLAPTTGVDWRIVSQVVVGSTVINERVDRFQINGGWLELPVAGFFEVSDGLITLWRDYFDMGSYMTQLSALMSNT